MAAGEKMKTLGVGEKRKKGKRKRRRKKRLKSGFITHL